MNNAPALPCPPEEFFSKRGFVAGRFDDRRQFRRLHFRCTTKTVFKQTLPAIQRDSETVTIYICDISRSGIGFLSRYEIYPQECLEIPIPEIGAKVVTVCRCRRLAKDCFEVGGTFVEAG